MANLYVGKKTFLIARTWQIFNPQKRRDGKKISSADPRKDEITQLVSDVICLKFSLKIVS